jgi:hypothetical protein
MLDQQQPYAVGDLVLHDEGESISDYLYHPERIPQGHITQVIPHTTYTYVLDWKDEAADTYEYAHEKLLPPPPTR